jgi:hypothetical protein
MALHAMPGALDARILGHDGCFLNGKIRVIAIFQAKDLTYELGLG